MLRESIPYMLRESLLRMRQQFESCEEDDLPVERKRHHRHVHFDFFPTPESRRRRFLMLLCSAALAVVFLFSAVKLIGYGVEYLRSRSASADLRQAYYEEKGKEASITPLPTATPTQVPATAAPVPTQAPEYPPIPTATATPVTRLEKQRYPDNPYTIVSSRFQKLRRQNEDIIGWLTIEDVLDEAVVQRDNAYYLDRDYKGYHNKNGAIFLDESTDLRTRPYTLMLYGHNMKSGLMFGCLRNYENPTYYRKNPFITFDTAYENGRYVIFAVSTVSTDAKNWRFVNFAWLMSSTVPLRTQAIASLNRFSVYNGQIDVRPDDQLLLLVTCVDDVNDRRIVAARRLRDGENEENLLQIIKKTRLK